jgi:hypothetical protein
MYSVETNFKGLRMAQNLHDTLKIYQYMLAKYKNNVLLTKFVKSYNLEFAFFVEKIESLCA